MKKKLPAAVPRQELPSRLIRKSNELVEARYRYDIWQMRVFAKVLSLIKPTDSDFYEYKIFLTDFIKEFGLKKGGNIYQLIKSGAEGLLQKKVVVDELLDGRPSELHTWLLSSVQSFKDGQEANYLQVTIHPKLRPYLLELRQKYLVYDIRNVLRLTSVYSVRIYELLKQYEKIGRRTFDVENLKQILGILPEEYKLYGHFKDKVIRKSQADLQAETDISFDFEEKKAGKRVVAITFFIHPNRQDAADATSKTAQKAASKSAQKAAEKIILVRPESPFFEELAAKTAGWGIVESKMIALWADHGEARARQALEMTEAALEQKKIKDSASGFFIKALREGWKSPRQTVRKQAVERLQKSDAERQKQLVELPKWKETLEILLDSRRAAANEIVKTLAADDPEIGRRAVEAILQNRLTRSLLEKSSGRTGLETLELDAWRADRMLREAVVLQIEKLRTEAFLGVQIEFDAAIKRLRRAISAAS